jgi:hypothetical protein
MKRSLGFIVFLVGLNILVHAQAPDTTRQHPQIPSPAKQAAHQLKMLQQQLNLNDDQVVQLQVILINRDAALDSIRRSKLPAGGPADPRADGRARRAINQAADQKINSMLTPEQIPLYQQWKQQQREKLMEKRLQATQPQPAS